MVAGEDEDFSLPVRFGSVGFRSIGLGAGEEWWLGAEVGRLGAQKLVGEC